MSARARHLPEIQLTPHKQNHRRNGELSCLMPLVIKAAPCSQAGIRAKALSVSVEQLQGQLQHDSKSTLPETRLCRKGAAFGSERMIFRSGRALRRPTAIQRVSLAAKASAGLLQHLACSLECAACAVASDLATHCSKQVLVTLEAAPVAFEMNRVCLHLASWSTVSK